MQHPRSSRELWKQFEGVTWKWNVAELPTVFSSIRRSVAPEVRVFRSAPESKDSSGAEDGTRNFSSLGMPATYMTQIEILVSLTGICRPDRSADRRVALDSRRHRFSSCRTGRRFLSAPGRSQWFYCAVEFSLLPRRVGARLRFSSGENERTRTKAKGDMQIASCLANKSLFPVSNGSYNVPRRLRSQVCPTRIVGFEVWECLLRWVIGLLEHWVVSFVRFDTFDVLDFYKVFLQLILRSEISIICERNSKKPWTYYKWLNKSFILEYVIISQWNSNKIIITYLYT